MRVEKDSDCNYRNESNYSNKIISGVRILWNTLINDFSWKRGVIRTISGIVRKLDI